MKKEKMRTLGYNCHKNVIGRLGKPRLKLIKVLAREKYGERNHSAMEINTVIAENELQLYKSNGSLRTEKQIADAMSKAHKRLSNGTTAHHPSCGCASCDTGGEHIVVNPHS
jgi:hypothetical protein